MDIKKILVVGGTGMLGFPVAKKLIQDDFDVNILTRNPAKAKSQFGNEYSFVSGDVTDLRSVIHVFETGKYDGVHINLSAETYKDIEKTEIGGTANLVNAAKKLNIQKITIISGLGVHQRNAWSRFIRLKLKIEKIITSSEIPFTIFNCTHFMESIEKYVRNGKITIMGKQPHRFSWIAASDYAKMVSEAFKIEESNNQIISVLGPEKMTMKEFFQNYIDMVDPSLKVTEVPIGMLKVIASVTFNDTLKYIVDLMIYFAKTAEHPKEGTLLDILGKPTTTIDAWMAMQKSGKIHA